MKQLLIFLTCLPATIYSQNITLQGYVLDEYNNPLDGVSIYIKDTNQGTITNEDGEFKFIFKEDVALVTFSYLGYNTKEININSIENSSDLKINLLPYEEVLEEVLISTVPITDLLKSIIEKSKNKLKKSAVLTTYNREVLKTDSTYCYFAESLAKYHLKGKRKKIKSDMYVLENRVLGLGCQDQDKFLKSNPFGHNVRNLVKESFKENGFLELIFKSEHRYEFILKSKAVDKNTIHNTIEFSPKDDDFSGYRFKGYVIYDEKSELILEVYIRKASNDLKDAFNIESSVLKFSAIDIEQKISYRIENDNYILVYNKGYQRYYIGNIFFNTYEKEYSFFNDITVLDYKEGAFDFKKRKEYKDDYLFSLGNKFSNSFWENISISETTEEKKFKAFYNE